MAVWKLGVCVLVGSFFSHFLAQAQHFMPKPPLGWQEKATSKFEPTIESVLVELAPNAYYMRTEEASRAWNAWGPGASDPLLNILRDPAWKDFHTLVTELLFLSPFPETSAAVQHRVHELTGIAVPVQRDREELSILMHAYVQHGRHDEAYSSSLELIQSQQPHALEVAARVLLRIHNENAWNAAKRAISNLPSDKQKALAGALEDARGFLRAQEPMPGRHPTYFKSGAMTPPPALPAYHGQHVSPPDTVHVRVRDTARHPIRRIEILRALRLHSGNYRPREDGVLPASGRIEQVLTSDDGMYTVPNSCYVQAEGTSRRFVYAAPDDSLGTPIDVVLGAPATIVIHVVTPDGEPVKGAAVGPALDYVSFAPDTWSRFQTTDEQGRVMFDRLPEDTYFYVVQLMSLPNGPSLVRTLPVAFVGIRAAWGDRVERKATVGEYHPGTPGALYAAWRWEFFSYSRILNPEDKLSVGQRRGVEKIVIDQLQEMPVMPQWARDVEFLVTVATLFEIREAAVPIKRLLASKALKRNLDPGRWPDFLTDALLELGADDSVGYFRHLAEDSNATIRSRQMAVVALGRIGTRASVRAFSKLRNAAYAEPGAPAPRVKYTHAERMVEAAVMSSHVIPDKPYGSREYSEAWVSEDYEEGKLHGWRGTVRMQRRGDEWMVVGFDPYFQP